MEFAQPVDMCFVDLGKAYDRVPGALYGGLYAYGGDDLLLWAIRSSFFF